MGKKKLNINARTRTLNISIINCNYHVGTRCNMYSHFTYDIHLYDTRSG